MYFAVEREEKGEREREEKEEREKREREMEIKMTAETVGNATRDTGTS